MHTALQAVVHQCYRNYDFSMIHQITIFSSRIVFFVPNKEMFVVHMFSMCSVSLGCMLEEKGLVVVRDSGDLPCMQHCTVYTQPYQN